MKADHRRYPRGDAWVNAAADVAAVILDLIEDETASRPFSGLAGQRASDYTVIAAGTHQVRLTASANGEELVHEPEFTNDRDAATSLYAIAAVGVASLTVLPVRTQVSHLPTPATPGANPTY